MEKALKHIDSLNVPLEFVSHKRFVSHKSARAEFLTKSAYAAFLTKP
jgi:hypothetical protein